MVVGWLITQRSQVKILPPLPSKRIRGLIARGGQAFLIVCPRLVREIRPRSPAGGAEDRHQAVAPEEAAVDVAHGDAQGPMAATRAPMAAIQVSAAVATACEAGPSPGGGSCLGGSLSSGCRSLILSRTFLVAQAAAPVTVPSAAFWPSSARTWPSSAVLRGRHGGGPGLLAVFLRSWLSVAHRPDSLSGHTPGLARRAAGGLYASS
jgi:hypothetical protein